MSRENNRFGLISIRNRILFFAIVVTILPSLCVGWVISNMMHRTLEEKIEQNLLEISNSVDMEINLWVKERIYDLHVFSNSYIIHENFSKYLEGTSRPVRDKVLLSRSVHAIHTYLNSLQKQYFEYDSILLLDAHGAFVASSQTSEMNISPTLPEDMNEQLVNSQYFIELISHGEDRNPVLFMGTPLYNGKNGAYSGVLALEVSLSGIRNILRSATSTMTNTPIIHSMLFQNSGDNLVLIVSGADEFQVQGQWMEQIIKLFGDIPRLHYFVDPSGKEMTGVFSQLEMPGWELILSHSYEDVFSSVAKTRLRNFLIICFLSGIIGVASYYLTRPIIRPLRTLALGAKRVADGDLSVRLPVEKKDELGFTTSVFNEMVAKLKESQANLEKLATQDVLTQLANRKQILLTLHNRFEYYQRQKSDFSILMIDVDHFKRVNDTYGHLAGDRVLAEISQIFVDKLRGFDSAGRYGGEEFLVILTDSDENDASNVAERIRLSVSTHKFLHENMAIQVTVSIGIAKVSVDDMEERSLIKRADKALYIAKEEGRNRIAYLE